MDVQEEYLATGSESGVVRLYFEKSAPLFEWSISQKPHLAVSIDHENVLMGDGEGVLLRSVTKGQQSVPFGSQIEENEMGRLADELKKSAADMNGMAAFRRIKPRRASSRGVGPGTERSEKLWVLTANSRLTLDDFVPASHPAMKPVRHYGRNTLPVFKYFEKRFVRAPEGTETEGLWGYNEG